MLHVLVSEKAHDEKRRTSFSHFWHIGFRHLCMQRIYEGLTGESRAFISCLRWARPGFLKDACSRAEYLLYCCMPSVSLLLRRGEKQAALKTWFLFFPQFGFASFHFSLVIHALIGIIPSFFPSYIRHSSQSLASLAKYLSASRDLPDIRQPAPDCWWTTIRRKNFFQRVHQKSLYVQVSTGLMHAETTWTSQYCFADHTC